MRGSTAALALAGGLAVAAPAFAQDAPPPAYGAARAPMYSGGPPPVLLTERRSPAMMGGGIVLTVLGGGSLITGTLLILNGTRLCHTCATSNDASTLRAAGITTGLLGIAGVGVGIPLTIIGGGRVPVGIAVPVDPNAPPPRAAPPPASAKLDIGPGQTRLVLTF
jgi:hypothetical protein